MSTTFLSILSCILLLSSSASAGTFNITRLLSRYDGYGTFNNLLSQNHLAGNINHRKTITVLAIHDSSIGDLASKPQPIVKRILMNHVLLDYYDMYKLKHLKHRSTLVTTLYQTTGEGKDRNGYINVTVMGNGEVKIASGVRGSQLDVTLNKFIAAQPYNISALEVSGPIIAPGVEDMYIAPAAPPRKLGPTPAPAPAPHKKKHHKSPPAYSPDMEDTEDDTDDPTADGPADDDADAPAPSKSLASGRNATSFSLVMVLTVITTFGLLVQ